MHFKLAGAAAVALAATTVLSQTHTECDPTKRRDCKNPKALGSKKVDIDWTKGKKADDFFHEFAGTTLTYDNSLGAVYNIAKDTDAPTVGSNAYIFFGRVDVTLRAAAGKGIVTSVVLQSDDLDEIDWEWVGVDTARVQTNYFSKGCNRTYDRGGYANVQNPVNEFHTYSIEWTSEKLDWIIDGTTVRTLTAADAEGRDCGAFPQSPMQIRLGSWIGGRPSAEPGTIEWAGGLANFADGPFRGYYKNIKVTDYMGGRGAKEAKEYHYTDLTGSWKSIKVVGPDGNEVDDKDGSDSSSKTTKTTAKTTATTLSPSTTAGSNSSSAAPTGSSDQTSGAPGGASRTTGAPSGAPTSGAGKVALNAFGAAAALFAGVLAL